jgi:hypothetical protein
VSKIIHIQSKPLYHSSKFKFEGLVKDNLELQTFSHIETNIHVNVRVAGEKEGIFQITTPATKMLIGCGYVGRTEKVYLLSKFYRDLDNFIARREYIRNAHVEKELCRKL